MNIRGGIQDFGKGESSHKNTLSERAGGSPYTKLRSPIKESYSQGKGGLRLKIILTP